eukprot:9483861-Pyramimonas_sp.AAC.1
MALEAQRPPYIIGARHNRFTKSGVTLFPSAAVPKPISDSLSAHRPTQTRHSAGAEPPAGDAARVGGGGGHRGDGRVAAGKGSGHHGRAARRAGAAAGTVTVVQWCSCLLTIDRPTLDCPTLAIAKARH